jgi:hypothetical protein
MQPFDGCKTSMPISRLVFTKSTFESAEDFLEGFMITTLQVDREVAVKSSPLICTKAITMPKHHYYFFFMIDLKAFQNSFSFGFLYRVYHRFRVFSSAWADLRPAF